MSALWNAVESHARTRGDTIALADPGDTCTYGELPGAVHSRSEQLRCAGSKVLALCMDNCIDWVLWDLAAVDAKVVCVPIPPFFSEAQSRHILTSAGVDTVVDCNGLHSPVPNREAECRLLIPGGTAKITYTSGSTGEPKGVCLGMDGLERVAVSLVDVLGTGHAQNHLAVMPLAVLLENIAGVYTALLAGCRIDLPSCSKTNSQPRDLLRTLRDTGATTAILVPQLLRGLITVMRESELRLPALRFLAVGGSKVAPALITQARDLGLPVYEGYGLSECGSVVALNTPAHDRPGTVGRALPHLELSFHDGEIIIDNPVSLGYLGDVPTGRIATGDLGSIDAEGYLTISGRKKNVLITSSGRNIAPEWVETALLGQAEVAQTIVYGDGCATLSALVVPSPNSTATAIAEAVQRANDTLPEYARIKQWRRVPAFTVNNGLLTGNGRPIREVILKYHTLTTENIMEQTGFFELLEGSTEPARRELYRVPQLADAMQGRISRETYVAYLTEAYHHVKHTVRFLMAMGAKIPLDKQWLQDAIVAYIDEEKGHENWILSDIEAAGGDRERARRSIPNLETQVLVSYNYDYIARRDPIGFLGMVYMLESTSVQIAAQGAQAVQNALGLPDQAFSYLLSHGELDQKHMQSFRGLMDKLDDPLDQAAIVEVANNTFRLFANVIRSIPYEREMKYVA